MKKNNNKSKKLMFGIIIAGLIITSGASYYFIKLNPSKTNKQELKLSYSTVEKSNIINSISTTGKISSNLDIDIKCKASGEVIDLPFDISDKVKKGDLILKLNPVDEQQVVKQSEMSLVQTDSSLSKAKQDLLLTQKNLDNAISLAETNLKTAKIRLNEARTNLNMTKNLSLTRQQTVSSNVESATIKVKELNNKFEISKKLYNKGYISKNEYDSNMFALEQAKIELDNARTKISEEKTLINNDNELSISNIKQAEIDVLNAETNLKEKKEAKINLLLKEQDIKSLQAKLESDKSSLSNAKQRLKDTEVFSPIDGVVTNKLVQKGQIITSGMSNVSEGTTVLTISDLSRLFIMASVDESDIGKVKLGQEANITVDAFPEKRFKGKVVQIYTKGENNSNVVTFPVKIEIKSKNKDILKPEMTSNVEIFTAQKDDILTIPMEAVIRKQRKYFVQVKKENGQNEERNIEVGINDGNFYEVISGLKQGDQILMVNAEPDNPWKNNRNDSEQRRQTRRVMGGLSGRR